MDVFEDSRRRFLGKLGLTLGTAVVTASGLSANIAETAEVIKLTPDQHKFMQAHEKWLDEFTEIIRFQKIDAENMDNNKRLMALSEQSKTWQNELTEYMKDENFARYYMIVTQRVTNQI